MLRTQKSDPPFVFFCVFSRGDTSSSSELLPVYEASIATRPSKINILNSHDKGSKTYPNCRNRLKRQTNFCYGNDLSSLKLLILFPEKIMHTGMQVRIRNGRCADLSSRACLKKLLSPGSALTSSTLHSNLIAIISINVQCVRIPSLALKENRIDKRDQ